ncbi:hypothetical protein EIP86_007913 [Pleurotus ostreatoroseus]|nr:hypothetical protein EIP86_007913 [Pleurotus ostreatoroseus]
MKELLPPNQFAEWWGDYFYLLDMESVREVLRFIECVLKGLAYMHSHRIVHRDVTELNIVVNCYRLDGRLSRLGQTLRPHRRTDNVYYAFMDYDQSIMLPSETCVKTCLRPIAEWQYGSPQYKPPDIAPGQLAYNPFAFDVGMLGNMFRCHFANVVHYVPALAPLFDKMTNHLIPQRFTAEEAYAFFQETTKDLDQETLLKQVKLEFRHEFDSAYWDQLPFDVQRKWDRYRTPATENDPGTSEDVVSESEPLSKSFVLLCDKVVQITV